MGNSSSFSIVLTFLAILLRGKRLIIVGTLVPTLIAVTAVLLSKSVYKSEALINPPAAEKRSPFEALGLGGMTGALGSLLGSEKGGLDDCLSILNSARYGRLVVERFGLEKEWTKKAKPNQKIYEADILKRFRRDAKYSITDEKAIQISMKSDSPEKAFELVSYMIFALDSLYTEIQRAASRQRLAYVDARLAMARAEMTALEDSLVVFKTTHNLLIPETQVKMILENTANTELRLETLKEAMALEAALRGETSPRYRDLETQKRLLERSLQRQFRNAVDSNSLILPTRTLPALATEYFRLERAYTIRLGVYKYLVQQVELLKLEADKNVQVISVVDPPWVNGKRVSPKRRVVVQATFMLSFLVSCMVVLLLAGWRRYRLENPDSQRRLDDLKRIAFRL